MELNYYQSVPGIKQLADELEDIAACDIYAGMAAEAPLPVVVNPVIFLDAHGPIVVSPAIDAVNKHIAAAFEAAPVTKTNDETKQEQGRKPMRKLDQPPTWLPELALFDSTSS